MEKGIDMRHYKSQRKLVLVFALAASILGNCGSAEAGVTITNGLTKIHKVTPGEIQEGHINIQNNGLKSPPHKQIIHLPVMEKNITRSPAR